MKHLVLALLLVALAPLALADAGSGTVTWNTSQGNTFDKDRADINAVVCYAYNLPASCTQVQARAAFCLQPGSSGAVPCTVAGVSSNTIRIYGDTLSYLDGYLLPKIAADSKAARQAKAQAAALTAANAKLADLLTNGTQADKDAWCTQNGLAAGCLP